MKRERLWLIIVLLASLLLVMAGCSGEPDMSTLTPKGSAGEISFGLMKLSTYIMMGVMLVVFVIYAYVLIRFRKKKNDNEIPKQTEGSTVLEVTWTLIPILLLIILAIPTIAYTFSLAKDHSDEPGSINVKVTAHQYWWEFEYPDQKVVTSEDLYIPVGKRINVQLTSDDVIHSFWIPSLMGKIDTNPGFNAQGVKQNVNTAWFDAKEPGVYKGKCAELCGAGHALMDFKVIAVSDAEFDAWVKKMTSMPTPTTDAAKAGEGIFTQNCMGCHAVDGTTKKPFPNLAGIGDRQRIAGILDAATDQERRDSLAKWISDPQKVKVGTHMPSFGDKLTKEQIDSLVDYLTTLKFSE